MLDDLDVVLQLVDGHAELLGKLRDLMVLEQPQMLGDDALGGRSLQPEMPGFSVRHSCRSRAQTPMGSNACISCSARSTSSIGHGPIAASSSTDATR